jgi:CRISPR system Cascade subunit CasA
MCESCSATALYTLQINAPSGGVGHRVGLRGGGPLTTLVAPTEETTLWHKLWLNVLDAENYMCRIGQPRPDVFPWIGQVRISDKGVETRPEDVHALQAHWGMPRRIKLISSEDNHGTCDLCGAQDSKLIKDYTTRNYGINYVGEWVHPLTPYRFDPKKEKPPLSVKGQKGGLGYRHWIGLILAHSDQGDCAAKVATTYSDQRSHDMKGQRIARLWCFGYDMDNMKARCWYDHTLPLFHLDKAQRENVLSWASELINAAWDVAGNLRSQVKAAWFRRPGDVKGDMSGVVQEFWQRSEIDFYELLEHLVTFPSNQGMAPKEIYDTWVKKLQGLAYRLFDEWALEAPAEDLDMKRIVTARRNLAKNLNNSQPMKELIARSK